MSNRCLVLLTKQYPFAKAEEFIESEYEYMNKYYDKIFIFATDVKSNAVITRNISKKTVAIKISRSYIKEMMNKNKCQSQFDMKSHIVYSKVYCILESHFIDNSDRIVFYSFWCNYNASVAVKLHKKYKKSIAISRAHYRDLYVSLNEQNSLQRRTYLYDNLNMVFTSSLHGYRYLVKYYQNLKDKFQISYLGSIDFGENNNKSVECFKIITCARLVENKRVILVAKAIEKLVEKGVCIEWTIVGDGPKRDELRKFIYKKLPLDCIRNLGELKHDELIKLYMTEYFDLIINTSISDGLPVALIEALSFGIPILLTDAGPNVETVESGKNGFIIPNTSSYVELANAIEHIIKLPYDEYKTMRNHSRKHWLSNFDARIVYNNFYKLLSSMEI